MGEGDALERSGPEAMDTSCVKGDLGMEIDAQPCREGAATAEDWRRALAKVVPAVVVLRTTAARGFDTETAGASYATGFVVDKGRGIILTNRHVVKPGTFSILTFAITIKIDARFLSMRLFCAGAGPVVAEAMFVNREEIPVYPIYRDPVSSWLQFHQLLDR